MTVASLAARSREPNGNDVCAERTINQVVEVLLMSQPRHHVTDNVRDGVRSIRSFAEILSRAEGMFEIDLVKQRYKWSPFKFYHRKVSRKMRWAIDYGLH